MLRRTDRSVRRAHATGRSARFIPYADRRIVIDPYVLTEQPLTLSVPARRIASRAYADDGDLRAI